MIATELQDIMFGTPQPIISRVNLGVLDPDSVNIIVTLEDLAAPASDNYQIAIIPIGGSATNFYTVEARRFTGYDVKLPGEAVIIHNVDTTNGIPALLVPGGLSSTNPGVRFIEGEMFHDATNHITVKVNSDQAGTELSLSIPIPGMPQLTTTRITTTTVQRTSDQADQTIVVFLMTAFLVFVAFLILAIVLPLVQSQSRRGTEVVYRLRLFRTYMP